MKSEFKKKAEMGMGTLIIFIAMILVAAIAASVLITTTGSLQSKALATGMAAKQQIGTSINVISITGENGLNGDLNNFSVTLQLSAGSDPIKLGDLLVLVTTNAKSYQMSYTNTTLVADTSFAVNYALNGTDHMAGYLVSGDVAEVQYELTNGLTSSQQMQLSLIPKVGVPTTIQTVMPNVLFTQKEAIYP